MTTHKSPFYIVPEFMSPLMCEDVLSLVDFTVPNLDRDDEPTVTVKSSQQAEELIFERVRQIVPAIEDYYEVQYKGTEPMAFEWYPTGVMGKVHAENSEFLRKKWLRVRPWDFTGVIFMSDYFDSEAFDSEYEVYGGKLEFPQHQFGFNPTRGTLVLFPSDPHFINTIAKVKAGDLFLVRMQIVCQQSYLYDPTKFGGNYTTWFNNL